MAPRPDLHHRLYRTKLALIATICTVAGLGLLLLAAWASGQLDPMWLAIEAGAVLFTTGLIAILFEYVDRQDGEERATERLRRTLAEAAPDLRKAVLDGFALRPDEMAKVAAPATLDRVAENCLAIRLGDKQLAADAYADLREQVVRARERRYDMDVSITLSPWDKGPTSGRGAMFVATVRREYRVTPSQSLLRFACVSDLDEQRELLQDPTSTLVHYSERLAGADIASDDAFRLVGVMVNGHARPIRRTTRVGSQVYTASIGREAMASGEDVLLSYTYRVLVQQNGHLFSVDVAKPTRGLKVQFYYGNCGIRYVNVLDYIASAQRPRLLRGSAADPSPSIEVGFDGWVFPKAGVAFVWILEEEITHRDSPS